MNILNIFKKNKDKPNKLDCIENHIKYDGDMCIYEGEITKENIVDIIDVLDSKFNELLNNKSHSVLISLKSAHLYTLKINMNAFFLEPLKDFDFTKGFYHPGTKLLIKPSSNIEDDKIILCDSMQYGRNEKLKYLLK